MAVYKRLLSALARCRGCISFCHREAHGGHGFGFQVSSFVKEFGDGGGLGVSDTASDDLSDLFPHLGLLGRVDVAMPKLSQDLAVTSSRPVLLEEKLMVLGEVSHAVCSSRLIAS